MATTSTVDIGALQRGSNTSKTAEVDIGAVQREEDAGAGAITTSVVTFSQGTESPGIAVAL